MTTRAALALAASLLAGCAAIPWPHAARPRTSEPGDDGWLDLRGVVHVHTNASHDSPATLASALAAARETGVAWIGLTEHTRPGQSGPYGTLDGVLVLPGFEASAAGASLLTLGVAEPPPPTRDAAELVRWTHERGGAAFVGHFEHSRLRDAGAFTRAAPDGVEIVNLHANALERRISLGWRIALLPGGLALRSLGFVRPENLASWCALPGPPPIVGAVDAHEKFRLLGALGGTVDRYRDTFRVVTTHVWVREASAAAVLEALRVGRSYVALEGLGRVDAFRFEATRTGYRLEAPQEARLSLLCDGAVVASAKAQSALLAPPAGARSCRAEARLDDRLWILTSPDVLPMARP